MITRSTLLFILLSVVATTPAHADDEIFAVSELKVPGRIVAAELADFDGNGANDLVVATLEGIPPTESRLMHVYLRQPDDGFPRQPSHVVPIPDLGSVYDIADLRPAPGDEMIILRPDGVTILSLAHEGAPRWDLEIDGPSTVGAGVDERGFDSFRLVYDEFDSTPRLLVPQIGQVSMVDTQGQLLAELDVGRRTNYFVTRSSGLVSVETDIQLYLDAPKLAVGDVDGDGRTDLVSNTRHEIRVFLQGPDGSFAEKPSYTLPLGLIDREDHARGSGAVVTNVRDLDADGRLDLMISHSSGTFTKAVTTTYVYHNRDGTWHLDEPDDRFESDGGLSSDLLLDIDSDGAFELVRVQFKFSVLELVEFLLTREIDVNVSVHKLEADGSYDMAPWSKRKISTEVSFDTFRPKGFMPTGGVDLNNDGRMDFVSSAAGKGIEVYLGSEDGLLSKRKALQKLPSAGVIRFTDYDGDDLPDFLLWDPQSFDTILRIGRNLGRLSRSPERSGMDGG